MLTHVLSRLGKSPSASSRGQDALFQAINRSQAVISFELDGTILDANENFLNAMGYSLNEVKGRHHSIFVAPEDRDSEAYHAFWRDLGAGKFKTAEFRRIAKDGSDVWIQASYNLVLDSSGKPRSVIKFATDITVQKLQDIEMRGQVAAIRKSSAVISFTPGGTILDANDNFLDAMGYTLDEVKGRHHSIFVAQDERDSEGYNGFWRDLGAGRFKSGQFRRVAKDGGDVWIQATYNPIPGPDGRVLKVVKFASDITEQKLQAADHAGQIDAIRKSSAVISFSPDGTILEANDNFLSAMGYRAEEIAGQHHAIFVAPEERNSESYRDFWRDLGAGKFKTAEFRRIAKDGSDVWIQASYNPIVDPNGKVFKVVKFATDVTAQVEARKEAERVGSLVDGNLSKILESVQSIAVQAGSASSASTQTAATVQTVAAAAEEFDSSSREIAGSMEHSRAGVDRVTSTVEEADKETESLSQATGSMTAIIEMIQDIASQINLLALNATIESARAGEAGKGFAVVASEVKSLANQVANATSQIAGEIENVQTVSATVVERLRTIRQAMEPVQSSVAGVASAVEQQSAASQEIAGNMQTASTSVDELNANLAQISTAVKDASRLAEEGVNMYRELEDLKRRDAA